MIGPPSSTRSWRKELSTSSTPNRTPGIGWFGRAYRQGFQINRKRCRIVQIKGWQCHRRLRKRCSPRVESSPSVTTVSDVRWATDATCFWTRFDGLVFVNAVIDCANRECTGLNVSQRNDAREAAWALEDALIRRFGALAICVA